MNPFKVVCDRRALLFVLVQCFILQSEAYIWMSPSLSCDSSNPAASATDTAPEMPTLPSQYSMKVEANILQKNRSVEVEEHFDSVNQRASVSITRNGTTVVSIFNFQTGQRYDIYSNGTCKTRPSSIDYLGFVKERQTRPVMATVNEVFRFGTGFNMTYVGRETVRGIRVNHWTSCQNWTRFGAYFQLDYYFSDAKFTMATGMSEIPVRAVLNGSATSPGRPAYTFQHSYEFISFRAGPILNEEVFQIPPGIVCSGRNDNKPLPAIPDQLEMSMEVLVSGKKKRPFEEYLVYDYNHKLVETFTTMVVSENMNFAKVKNGEVKADNDNLIAITVSVVKDYKRGLVYITEMLNMTCSVRKISSFTSNMTMTHSQNLLAAANTNNQFMYQGQATVRHMLVDMWAMEQGGISTELYFLPKVGHHTFQPLIGMFIKNSSVVGQPDMPRIFQELFQADGKPWVQPDNESEPDQPPNPSTLSPKPQITGDQLAWGLQLQRVLDQYTSQKEINIFHYSPLHLDTKNFQVSHCYQEEEISHVILIIMANYYNDVLINEIGFSNSLRNALAERAGFCLLHVSNLALTSHMLDESNTEATKVTFDLLGATPISGLVQKSLSQVKQDLLKAIKNGISFHVQYVTNSKDFMVHKSMYTLDYKHPSSDDNKANIINEFKVTNSETSDSSNAKYTPSTVAGIAIGTLLLGLILGLGAIFLTYQCKHPKEPLVSYNKQSDC